jgi:hypothetical protein
MPFFTFTLDFSPFFLRFSSVFDFSQSYFHEFLILISTAFLLWNLLWEFTYFFGLRFLHSAPACSRYAENAEKK